MRFTEILAIAAAAALAVEAVPMAVSNQDQQNQPLQTIPIGKTRRDTTANKQVAARRWARRSNNDQLHQRDSVSVVPLVNQQDELYSCQVTVGNGQQVTLNIDTGAQFTWIRGPNCTSSCKGLGKAFVTPDHDSTFAKQTDSGTKLNGVLAEVYTAPVTIGDVTANNLAFALAYEADGFKTSASGVLGLGFYYGERDPNGQYPTNFWGSNNWNINFLDASGTKQVGFYLSNSADGDSGSITLGGADRSHYTGDFVYIPISTDSDYNPEGLWAALLTGATYRVNGASGTLDSAFDWLTVEPGTTQIILDDASTAAINKAIGATYDSNQNEYTIPCSVASSGPDVVLSINSYDFTIPASNYVLNQGDNTCVSGFGSFGQFGTPFVVLGDVFIRSYYTLFDKSTYPNRIGFAPAVHPSVKYVITPGVNTTKAHCQNGYINLQLQTTATVFVNGEPLSACQNDDQPQQECGLIDITGTVTKTDPQTQKITNLPLRSFHGNAIDTKNPTYTFTQKLADEYRYYGGNLVFDIPCKNDTQAVNSLNGLAVTFSTTNTTVNLQLKNGKTVTIPVSVTTAGN